MRVLSSSSTVYCVPQAPRAGKGLSASHKEVSLVYFSTFEPINLTPDSIMQQAGVPMLYDSASNPRLPCLYNESTSALLQTCWGAPPSFRASLAATVTPRFQTASRTISVLEAPGQQRLGSDTVRHLLWPALPRVVAERIKVLVMISYLISYTISYHISI